MAFQLVKLIDPIQLYVNGTFTPRGAYAGGTDYAVGDMVSYLGSSYIMYVDAVAGTLPTDSTKWGIVASKGDTGDTGAPGADGAPGAAGADGADGADGAAGAAGADGAPGAAGADGADGVVQSIVAGTNVTVDATDPANPIVSSVGGATALIIQEDDVNVVAAADTIDFLGADFDVSVIGAEGNVALAADVVRDADIGVAIQAYDADLAAVAALTPTNDDFIQRKAGAWTNRTVAQVKTDLSLSGTNTGDQTNITGNAATVTTNADLTGDVTSTGNATTIGAGKVLGSMLGAISSAELRTALSDGTGTGANVFAGSPALTGTPTLAGATSGTIGLVATAIAGSNTLTLPAATDTLVGRATTDTLTNKRVTPRVVGVTAVTTVTPTSDTSDFYTATNTAAAGTLTMAAPTGTPTDGQPLIIRVKATNAQTYSWNASYRASTDFSLPTGIAAGKIDYIGFRWHSTDSKWDCVSLSQGY